MARFSTPQGKLPQLQHPGYLGTIFASAREGIIATDSDSTLPDSLEHSASMHLHSAACHGCQKSLQEKVTGRAHAERMGVLREMEQQGHTKLAYKEVPNDFK